MKYTELIRPKSPIDFELIIKNYLENIFGFINIETTPTKGDYGVDLFGEKDTKTYAIQIKYYKSPVNLKAVQEVYGAKTHFAKDKCMVITNSTFTESAISLANTTDCILIDGNDLNKMYSEKYDSFNKQIEYLKLNKLRSFQITNEQLINAYFELKQKLGKQPTIEDVNLRGTYSSSTYRKRWGRWNLFLVHINEESLVNRDITKNDLILNFQRVHDTIGKTPTTQEMRLLGDYSKSSYERYFGGWNKFLETRNIVPTKKHNIPKENFISEFKRIKSLLKKVPTKSEFDKHSNISSNSFNRIWGSWNAFLKDQNEQANSRTDITDDELISEYNKLKNYLGKDSLRQADMNEKGRFSSSTYERRFGSWNKFLKHIGETLNIDTEITQVKLLEDYKRISEKLNKQELTAKDIKEYSEYSLSTFLKKFGTWNNCKEEAKKYNR